MEVAGESAAHGAVNTARDGWTFRGMEGLIPGSLCVYVPGTKVRPTVPALVLSVEVDARYCLILIRREAEARYLWVPNKRLHPAG